MIFAIIRLVIGIAVLVFLYVILKKLFTPSDFKKCGRCEGKGFWYNARGKEICDWCNGSGRLPVNQDK